MLPNVKPSDFIIPVFMAQMEIDSDAMDFTKFKKENPPVQEMT